MNGWLGLICLAAYVWLLYCAGSQRALGFEEILVLSALMALVGAWLLDAWAKEKRETIIEQLEGE